ncbi:MAG TPA: flagellar motor protein MotB, partial [Mariprofundaceae bacterium]|nr:flagellar motor protein MotB [Mariprofundaceae bacterium]
MPARRTKKEEVEIKTDGWIATFGDLISLMLTFFVLIVSMSSLDESALKEVSGIVPDSAVSVFDNGPASDMEMLKLQKQRRISIQELMLAVRQQANKVLQHSVWRHKVNAHVLRNRMILRLPDSVLFDRGQATLKPKDIAMLKRLARLLSVSPGNIRIEGHTDTSSLPDSSPFRDPWSLSLARAASVLHVL